MKTQKLEKSLNDFRDELKEAMLNESAEITYEKYTGTIREYFAEIYVRVGDYVIPMTVADTFISYHNHLVENLMTENEVIRFAKIVKKHVRPLTDEEKDKIQELESQIKQIKNRL